MKVKSAISTAEYLWDDTIASNSFVNMIIQIAPHLEELRLHGKIKEMNMEVMNLRNEIVARWANIILEANRNED